MERRRYYSGQTPSQDVGFFAGLGSVEKTGRTTYTSSRRTSRSSSSTTNGRWQSVPGVEWQLQ